jgi:signal transduction histidine kinase
VLRSTSARLTALYTIGFAVSVAVLGAITLWTMHSALTHQFERRVSAESKALERAYGAEGFSSVVRTVRERNQTKGALFYGLERPGSAPLAGRLAGLHAPIGWSILQMREQDGDLEQVRALAVRLPNGVELVVGDAMKRTAAIETTVLAGFCWAFTGVVALGILGGYCFSRAVHRRLANMTAAADAIIHGDLDRRIPLEGSGDDLDRLAGVFNRTLDRISSLMDSLRHVSNDIAHDLRTPLTRLRQRLEAIPDLRRPIDREAAVAGALRDVDAILETFSALLRIAQVEGGARRAAFQSVDLANLSQTIVDAFAPSAEDAGQALSFEKEAEVAVIGDGDLLKQMLANLVENGLRHAGGRARVVVRTWRRAEACGVSVRDNGPGVPPNERVKILERFYRLERSRSTPGDGLGLALVAAIARLHGAAIELRDAKPGLDVTIGFAAGPSALRFPNVAENMVSNAGD